MQNEVAAFDQQQLNGLVPDFSYEDRHEFVERIAHKLWEDRGSPSGSPEVDWRAAERALYVRLVASGLIEPAADEPEHLRKIIYR